MSCHMPNDYLSIRTGSLSKCVHVAELVPGYSVFMVGHMWCYDDRVPVIRIAVRHRANIISCQSLLSSSFSGVYMYFTFIMYNIHLYCHIHLHASYQLHHILFLCLHSYTYGRQKNNFTTESCCQGWKQQQRQQSVVTYIKYTKI